MNEPAIQSLRHYWHPVAYAKQLTDAPLAATLLGESIVLWRDSAATAHAHRDRCLHRGTALSLGTVIEDQLVCPYHGWRFASNGQCNLVPQQAQPARVSSKLAIRSYDCIERLGLIWVALEPAREPIPSVPEFDDPQWHRIETGPFAWHAHASRQLENFTDFGHFPWVHPGLLGDPNKPVVAAHMVQIEGSVVSYAYGRPDQKNTEALPVFAEGERKDDLRRTQYWIHLPFTLIEHIDWGGRERMVYLFVSQPVDDEHCIGYCVVARNFNADQDPQVMQDFESTIFAQDQAIVESQRPYAVPCDPIAETHMPFDAVAIAYRKALRAHGLG